MGNRFVFTADDSLFVLCLHSSSKQLHAAALRRKKSLHIFHPLIDTPPSSPSSQSSSPSLLPTWPYRSHFFPSSSETPLSICVPICVYTCFYRAAAVLHVWFRIARVPTARSGVRTFFFSVGGRRFSISFTTENSPYL